MKSLPVLLLILAFSTIAPGTLPATHAGDSPAAQEIPGYRLGDESLKPSPIGLDEFALLQQTVLFTDDDIAHLRMSQDVLKPQIDEILDVWYGFVGSKPFLLKYFSHPTDGKPQPEYLAAVRKRFGQWILDTASANYDQEWLNYQYEIGRRHHRVGKNRTDGAEAADHIDLRYIVALHYPVTATLKPFLAKGGHDAATVEKMHQAWIKSVLLQTILWSQPYVDKKDF